MRHWLWLIILNIFNCCYENLWSRFLLSNFIVLQHLWKNLLFYFTIIFRRNLIWILALQTFAGCNNLKVIKSTLNVNEQAWFNIMECYWQRILFIVYYFYKNQKMSWLSKIYSRNHCKPLVINQAKCLFSIITIFLAFSENLDFHSYKSFVWPVIKKRRNCMFFSEK